MSTLPDWSPFLIAADRERPPYPRSIRTKEGVGDRLRSAAFAEIQARDAFRWAAKNFPQAPEELRQSWLDLADEEDKHLGWLLRRLEELDLEIQDRPVSAHLWRSFMSCETARDFAHYMATAEDRGRIAGERFHAQLGEIDPESARIFGQIAKEEVAHIELAQKFFPDEQILKLNS